MLSDAPLPVENQEKIRTVLKERRVVLNLTQSEVSSRAGVKVDTLRHFEQTGKISLINMLRLLSVYRMDERLVACLQDRSWWTLEQLQRAEHRKRAR